MMPEPQNSLNPGTSSFVKQTGGLTDMSVLV